MRRASRAVLAAVILLSTSGAFAGRRSDLDDLLARRDVVYAYELLDRPVMERLARRALGAAYDRFEKSLKVSPPLVVEDDRFVIGHGCRPHDCNVAKSTLVVDVTTNRILVALIDEKGSVVTPPMSFWPKAVAADAVAWDVRLREPGSRGASPSPSAERDHDVVDLSTIDRRVIYDHGGSEVLVDQDRGLIVYLAPKPSLGGVVVPGQVLFRGRIPDDGKPAEGDAYVFRRGCRPAPYRVTGGFRGEVETPTLVLRGSPPRRSASGCEVVGRQAHGPNATLEFRFLISP